MIRVGPDAPLHTVAAPAPATAALTIIRTGRRSVVSRAFATSPIKLLMPASHGRAAWIYTSSYGGGLVDGDHTRLEIDVGRGAAGFVSTQASTKIYRSPRGTSADLRARVAAAGLLVVLPDPVVCFAGSSYRQMQQVDLEPDAALVLLDWMSSGRHAAGERWAFDEYLSRITVRMDGRLVVYDALALRAADGSLASRLGRFNVLAVAVLAGRSLAEVAGTMMTRANRGPVRPQPDQLVAAAEAGEHAWVIRVAGMSVEQVSRTIRRLLDFVPTLLGDDPWARKW